MIPFVWPFWSELEIRNLVMLTDRQRVVLETSRERFKRAAVTLPVLDCWILFSDEQNMDLFEEAVDHPHRSEFGRTTMCLGHSMSAAFAASVEFNKRSLSELVATMRPAGWAQGPDMLFLSFLLGRASGEKIPPPPGGVQAVSKSASVPSSVLERDQITMEKQNDPIQSLRFTYSITALPRSPP